jgi:ribosome maturation protein SDO1
LVVSIEKAVVSRLLISGQKFEVLVDPEKALRIKKGENVDMRDALAYPAIYKDVRSAEVVSMKDLQTIFHTSDVFEIAKRIIKEGEIQLTTEQRKKMIEEKKNQIVNIIAKKSVDPRTNAPHPPQRILNAIEKAGVKIDPFLDAEAQVEKVLEKIKAILPLKFQKILLQIKVPPQYSGKVVSRIRNFGDVKSEEWLSDGSLQFKIEILAGVKNEFFNQISNLTHGNFESKILEEKNA